MDRLREIEVFAEIAEAGSFAEAARRLRMSPPAVTRMVASLEERLGTRLIHRTTRSMRLTEAGARFRETARQVLADLEAAEREAGGGDAEPRGRLSVTASTSFGRMAVAPVLARFLDRQPKVTASLLLVDRVVNLIEEGIDIGVRIGELPDSRLIGRRIGWVRRMLVASPAYLAQHGPPARPADLKAHPFLSFTGLMTTPGLRFGDGSRARHLSLTPRLELNDALTALSLAEAGHGITIALSYMIGDAIRAGRLVEVLPEHAQSRQPVHLVFPESRLMASTPRAFIDYAAPRLARLLPAD